MALRANDYTHVLNHHAKEVEYEISTIDQIKKTIPDRQMKKQALGVGSKNRISAGKKDSTTSNSIQKETKTDLNFYSSFITSSLKGGGNHPRGSDTEKLFSKQQREAQSSKNSRIKILRKK